MKIEKYLEGLYIGLNRFLPLSQENWEKAIPLFSLQNYDKDAYVSRAGDVVDKISFIASGMARYYYLTEEGKEFNKTFQTTGQVLTSISSLVTQKPSPYFIQTLEDTVCLRIRYEDLKELGEKYPQWSQLIIRMLEEVLIKKESREADFLQLDATGRYKKFLQEHEEIADLIPNYHIASYLGITEVRLSRIRGILKLT